MIASAQQRLPTLLLGAFALWSLLVTVCVYAGLGGRYSLHPDDPSQVPPLPVVDLSRAQNPLGALSEYAVVGERPLFNADRRPLPPPEAAEGPAEAAPPPVPLDVLLTSVVISGDLRIAIVQDKKTNKSQSVRVGNALSGEQANWKLVELGPRKAVFEGPTGRSEAELRVFDGSGGEAPTAVAGPEPVVSTDPAVAAQNAAAAAQAAANGQVLQDNPQTPEARAELIRKRIEERRRQMREEAERANKQSGG